MLLVLLQMALIIASGVVLRAVAPGGVDPLAMRKALTTLVYNLLLPALVFEVLVRTPLDVSAVKIALAAAGGVLGSMALAWYVCRRCRMAAPVTGAVLLAAGFPNSTYLGLPVLEATLGDVGRSVAVQYDLFACTPLLLTVGMLVAQRYGSAQAGESLGQRLLGVSPLWAALAAVVVQSAGLPVPELLLDTMTRLGVGVVPLMLVSLGLSLRLDTLRSPNLKAVVPVAVIQLLCMPLLVFAIAYLVGLRGDVLLGVVLEGAMPSMVLGVVICDRYGLDTELYATAVTITTLLSLLTLPAVLVLFS